ncbi:hypothetical protein TSUD_419450, partial [Trifolium subterraneum]
STDTDKPLKAYVTVVEQRSEGNTNNETWICNYCGGTYKGSYSRAEMRELETIATEKAKRVQVPFPNGTTSLNPPIDMTNTSISGYVPPNYNFIRKTMLQREKNNVEKLLQPIKGTWYEKGVSIVSDGWTDAQKRPLINFMAISSATPMFFNAIDGTSEFKDKYYIAKLILETISVVGAQNVVQIITDNALVCKAASSIVEGTYPHIFWSPCVVHTLNLALRNICAPKPDHEDVYSECNWIALTAADAKFIKKFITNHSMRFAMLKKFVDLSFLSISETRFASVIVMLKRFKTIKKGLMSLVISEEWSHYKEDDVQTAAFVKEMILNDEWWDKVEYILKFTEPVYDMLRSCDTDVSNLHLVYEK